VKHGQLKMLKWLLERGAEVNATLLHQETGLHLAVTRQDENQIRLLLLHKADPNRALNSGMYGSGALTPLHYAAGISGFRSARQPLKPNLKLVKLLIEHGASVEMKDETGKSIAEVIELQGSDELKHLIVSAR
jgi:ankyrin repeat protein